VLCRGWGESTRTDLSTRIANRGTWFFQKTGWTVHHTRSVKLTAKRALARYRAAVAIAGDEKVAGDDKKWLA
jgi:hypothetical protein